MNPSRRWPLVMVLLVAFSAETLSLGFAQESAQSSTQAVAQSSTQAIAQSSTQGSSETARSYATQSSGLNRMISQTLPKTVKIIGSGGVRGLEAYQSGFLISNDGHVLTAWSYVLDSDVVTLTMNDGLKREAALIGFDPRLDIAVLKIDVTDTPHFNLDAATTASPGDRILAFSNLYGVATGNEPVSVQRGFVTAKIKLSARKGTYQSPYRDEAYLLDAMTNNPGAAGGALTDRQGRLVAMIGKELRDSRTGAWLNFALPIEKLIDAVKRIRSGKIADVQDIDDRPTEPITEKLLGFSLVADIVQKTPPYVDRVIMGSAAADQGLQPDDLIVEVDGQMTASIKDVRKQLLRIDRDDAVEVTIQRGSRFVDMKFRLGQ